MLQEIQKAKDEMARLDAQEKEKKKPQTPNDPIIRPETDENTGRGKNEKDDDNSKKDKKPSNEDKDKK